MEVEGDNLGEKNAALKKEVEELEAAIAQELAQRYSSSSEVEESPMAKENSSVAPVDASGLSSPMLVLKNVRTMNQDETVVLEEVDKSDYFEMVDCIVMKQKQYLADLKRMFKVAFIVIAGRDGQYRSGLQIGSVQLIGFPLNSIPNLTHKVVDLDTILLFQKQADTTLGGCGLLCDLLVNMDKMFRPLLGGRGGGLRNRIKQRRGQYYYCSSQHEEVLMNLPLDRKSFAPGTEFYHQILSMTLQFVHYKHNYLSDAVTRGRSRRLCKLNSNSTKGPLPSLDVFVQLGWLHENV